MIGVGLSLWRYKTAPTEGAKMAAVTAVNVTATEIIQVKATLPANGAVAAHNT